MCWYEIYLKQTNIRKTINEFLEKIWKFMYQCAFKAKKRRNHVSDFFVSNISKNVF